MPIDPVIMQLKQDEETKTVCTFEQGGQFYYRFAYARSADSRANNDNGQDYITFCENSSRLAFAVCDGVSQSFFGDLAAGLVGQHLIRWFWKQETPLVPGGAAQVELEQYLLDRTVEATEKITEYRYPLDMPGMLQQVLEKKRQMGSESTFVSGVIDLLGGWYSLAWMGDTRLRLWGGNGEITGQLGDTFHTRERWSSSKGLVGSLHVYSGLVNELRHMMVYTDGLAFLDHAIRTNGCSNHALDGFIDEARQQPNSDDACVFEWWSSIPVFDSPPGKPVGLQRKRPVYGWQPDPRANRYEIALCHQDNTKIYTYWGDIPRASFSEEQLLLSSQVCIRAWNNDEPGEVNCASLVGHLKPASTVLVDGGDNPIISDQTTQIPPPKSSEIGRDHLTPPPAKVSSLKTPANPPRVIEPAVGKVADQADKKRRLSSEPIGKKPRLFWAALLLGFTLVIGVGATLLLKGESIWMVIRQPTETTTPKKPRQNPTSSLPFELTGTAKASNVEATFTQTAMTPDPKGGNPDSEQTLLATDISTPIYSTQTVTMDETPSTIINLANKQIITSLNIEKLTSQAFSKIKVQNAAELLFAAPISDSQDVLWRVLVRYQTNIPIDSLNSTAAVYDMDETGDWKLTQSLAPLRVAAFSGERGAGVVTNKTDEISIWQFKDNQWEEDSIPFSTQQVCAMTFDGNDLYVLERSLKLTKFKNSNAAGKIDLVKDASIADSSPESTCSVMVIRGDNDKKWLAMYVDKRYFIEELTEPFDESETSEKIKERDWPIIQIDYFDNSWWIGGENQLVQEGSSTPETLFDINGAFAINHGSQEPMLVSVRNRTESSNVNCQLIDFSNDQPGEDHLKSKEIVSEFCNSSQIYFTPDGKYLVTISPDGNVVIWFTEEIN